MHSCALLWSGIALASLLSACSCLRQESDPGPSMNASGRLSAEKLRAMTRQAHLGDSEAAYGIHQHYMFSHDPVRSLKWLRIAAVQGNVKAQHAMFDVLTWPGEQTPLEDRVEARLWQKKAAQAGDETAVEALREIEKKP